MFVQTGPFTPCCFGVVLDVVIFKSYYAFIFILTCLASLSFSIFMPSNGLQLSLWFLISYPSILQLFGKSVVYSNPYSQLHTDFGLLGSSGLLL